MWAPFSEHNAERRQSVGAPLVGALRRAKRKRQSVGAPLVGALRRAAKTRQSVGAPLVGALRRAKRLELCKSLCAIANSIRLWRLEAGFLAEKRRQLVGAPPVGALRGLLWRPNLDAISLVWMLDCFSAGEPYGTIPGSSFVRKRLAASLLTFHRTARGYVAAVRLKYFDSGISVWV